jgi:hypothetical protein
MSTAHNCLLIRFSIAFVIILCGLTAANAQAPNAKAAPAPDGAADAPKENYVLRTYEVGDLIINVQDYPYSDALQKLPGAAGLGSAGGGGFSGGGGGGGVFSVPDPDARSTQAHPQPAYGSIPQAVLCQFGGGGKGQAGQRPKTDAASGSSSASTAITIEDLVNVIVNTVANDTWAENGGAEGRIEALGKVLVVWQTPAVHEQIKKLLQALNQTLGERRTLTIDARWLQLTSNEVDDLTVKDSSDPPIVERKSLADLTRRAGSIRGLTNCFSGQLVYIVSGTKRNVVSGFIPVVGAVENLNPSESLVSLNRRPKIQLVADTVQSNARQASVGYQPIVVTPNFGALLEIRATSMGGPKSDVIVELRSTLTAATDSRDDAPRRASADVMAPAIDRVAIETQELATTLRVPVGKPVLVGGLTNVPSSAPAADGGQAKERPQTYLVLEIR